MLSQIISDSLKANTNYLSCLQTRWKPPESVGGVLFHQSEIHAKFLVLLKSNQPLVTLHFKDYNVTLHHATDALRRCHSRAESSKQTGVPLHRGFNSDPVSVLRGHWCIHTTDSKWNQQKQSDQGIKSACGLHISRSNCNLCTESELIWHENKKKCTESLLCCLLEANRNIMISAWGVGRASNHCMWYKLL